MKKIALACTFLAFSLPAFAAAVDTQNASTQRSLLPIASYSDPQRELLTFGYIRAKESGFNMNIPDEIKCLILKFSARDILDPKDCTCLKTLIGHTDSVNSVSWNHDSTRLASGSGDKKIKLWGVPEEK